MWSFMKMTERNKRRGNFMEDHIPQMPDRRLLHGRQTFIWPLLCDLEMKMDNSK